jgi:serine/threonine-protein kinase HipA
MHIADVDQVSTARYRLRFTAEAIRRFGEGSPVLSLGIPVTDSPVKDVSGVVRPVGHWMDNLLPEGNLRQQVAWQIGVPTDDLLGLFRAVGMECAGAVQLLPPEQQPGTGNVLELSDAQVIELVEGLPSYTSPDGQGPHASLAGIQDKLLLTRLPNGHWGWPQGGAVSTHIVKPEALNAGELRGLVAMEAWTLELAARAGVVSSSCELTTFGERQALVVERFDRRHGARIHQEDFCQILGLAPQDKYELANVTGPSRLATVSAKVSGYAVDPHAFRVELLKQVAFNCLIGNADAHSKNYSVLIDKNGTLQLSPLYDAAPLHHIAARFGSIGHVIHGKTRLASLRLDDLVAEAESWGLDRDTSMQTLSSLAEQIITGVEAHPPTAGARHIVDGIRTTCEVFATEVPHRSMTGGMDWQGLGEAITRTTASPASIDATPPAEPSLVENGFPAPSGTTVFD